MAIKGRGVAIAVGALAGLVVGAGGGYLLASGQFDNEVAALTQAADAQITAANRRIQMAEEQQRALVQINAANQRIQEAQEQQHVLDQQASEQQRARRERSAAQQATLVAHANEQQSAAPEKTKETDPAPAQPDLPVRVSLRSALMGSGKVAQLHNFGATELAVAVTVRSNASNQQKEWRIVIPANGTKQIGRRQGWNFAFGDELELLQDGYRPMKIRVGG
jgi:hypothetical protein